MPVRQLPPRPNLSHLKYQARDLLKSHAARHPEVAQRIREFHPRFAKATDAEIFNAKLHLSDAQLTIAREYGFPGWTRLKRHVEKPTLADQLNLPHHERIEDATFRYAVDLVDSGDAKGLRDHLSQHPSLIRQHIVFEGGNYFRNPTLLEFVAENPVRRGSLPHNIVEVTKVILEADAERSAVDETLGLVATGRVPRECGLQIPLINLLCDHGANPEAALHAAALREAMDALIARGARIDLPVAAALGRTDAARRLVPDADAESHQLALALAAQFGHVEIVRLLLDSGADPNRYSPGHSHSTPLHQAALAGHIEVVRLLVERGARLDMKDILWHATPAGWAKHAARTDIERYFRQQEDAKQKRDKES